MVFLPCVASIRSPSQISRSFVVAVKYGYFSASDYETMCTADFKTCSNLNITRHILLTAWMAPVDRLMETELIDSAARNRFDLEHNYFTVSRWVTGHDTITLLTAKYSSHPNNLPPVSK